jgi:hypothetical protein
MKIKYILLSIGTLIVLGLMIIPSFRPASNCGGNGYPLSACKSYSTSLAVCEADGTKVNKVSSLPENVKQDLSEIFTWYRLKDVKFLLRESINMDNKEQIIIVCDTPYDNHPKRNSSFAHAASLVSGKTILLSPEEYQKLDRNLYIHSHELLKKEKVEQEDQL